jgi:transcriptional regulator with XRE-family HTH domain
MQLPEVDPVAPSRLARAVRSARERAGWTREELAVHSGLSWAAIAQIESGRRQEIRVSSLLALAGALGVSVDYLAGGGATVAPNLLRHRALVYGSDDEYVTAALPFLRDGLNGAEAVLVVTAARQAGLLRDALGSHAAQVEFADSASWYSSPGAALRAYRDYVGEHFERGAPWVRILGEPLWAGRSDAEVTAWTRYESMLNIAFAPAPATIVCPYDTRSVPDHVVADARHTHPEVAQAGGGDARSGYREPEEFLLGVQ